jgi:hypothetical protein
MNTFPPPAPTPARKSRRLGLILGVTVAGLAIAGSAVAVAASKTDDITARVDITTTTTAPAPQMVTIDYTVSVGGEWCEDIENQYDDAWGYDDISGMEFQVRDENDKVIGHGELPIYGVDTDSSCDFSTTIKVPAASLYQIGNASRNYVTWDHTDVVNGRLAADAAL